MADEPNDTEPGNAEDQPVWELEQLGREPASGFPDRLSRAVRRHELFGDVLSLCWIGATYGVAVLLGSMWHGARNLFKAKEDRDV